MEGFSFFLVSMLKPGILLPGQSSCFSVVFFMVLLRNSINRRYIYLCTYLSNLSISLPTYLSIAIEIFIIGIGSHNHAGREVS